MIFLFLIGCTAIQPKPAPRIPMDTADCGSACMVLKAKHCPEGEPIPDPMDPNDRNKDITCLQFCEGTQESGHALSPSCVVRIRTCSDMSKIQLTNHCPF